MKTNLFLKIVTGYRPDQCYSINAEEAHKAYYLFLHPEERGVFKNGVALIGKNIQTIIPDHNRTMGWNPDYIAENSETAALDSADIVSKGIDRELRDVMQNAKTIAQMDGGQRYLDMPLSEIKLLT